MALIPQSRQDAQAIFQAGVAAADPYQAVKQHLAVVDGSLQIRLDNGGLRSGGWRRIHLVAFGKAACGMAKAAEEIIPREWLDDSGIAVTNYGNAAPLEHVQVLEAGHPLPDTAGFAAAKQLARHVANARSGELVLVLVSGGGSALIPYPVEPIALAEKIAVTELLLSCGATINQINCVRKHLSQLKGGGLAKLAATDLHALILSDVLGDDLASIASGPTVPDDTTYQDAVEILVNFGIWDKVPSTVREHLEQGRLGNKPETPKSGDSLFNRAGHTLIGGNALSVAAMADCARQLGYETLLYSQQLSGEARMVAEQLVAHAKHIGKPIALLAGGETTVTLNGTGSGGRNQEMALAFALAAHQQGLTGNWAFLSGGTDGRDGPTDAAGGLVDNGSLARMQAAGFDPLALLNNNDSYHALKASQDLLMTGATGTNVADLQILLLNP